MSLDKTAVKHIAALARIKVTEAETDHYAHDLSQIIDLVEQMNRINTDDVEPLTHPDESALRLRDDEVSESNRRDNYQTVAPEVESGLYLVPQVIE